MKSSIHRRAFVLSLVTVCLYAAFPSGAGPVSPGPFGPASANLSNRYGAWRVGTSLGFVGSGDLRGHTLSMDALAVETVDGVACLKVRVRPSLDAEQLLWLAQDSKGDVWQLRMHDGLTGETHGEDVLYIPAAPRVGEEYRLWDISYDTVYRVISTSATVTVPAGTFSDCLVLHADDFGDVEEWSLAPGIGLVRVVFSGFENGRLELNRFSGVGEGEGPGTHVVRGMVREGSASGAGVVGATVVLSRPEESLSATTDGAGSFEFPAVSAGTHTLRVTHECFESLPDQVAMVSESLLLPTIVAQRTMTPPPRLEASRDPDGNIRLEWSVDACAPEYRVQSATRVEGPYQAVETSVNAVGLVRTAGVAGGEAARYFRLTSGE